MVPLVQPWWMDFIVLGTVGCASVVFLLSAIIICYKAIKRWEVFSFSFISSLRVNLNIGDELITVNLALSQSNRFTYPVM